jgi:sugar/nucleoside kinase (ribokinase family)
VPRIACFGAAHIDRTARAASDLIPGTSNPVRWTQAHGGVARNVAACLARLGLPAALFSTVGDDDPGRAIIGELNELGIDVRGVAVVQSQTTASYVAALDTDGGLHLGLVDGALYDQMGEQWAASCGEAAADCEYWFVDANLTPVALAALLALRPSTTLVFADPVSAAKAARLIPHLQDLTAIFPDRAEAAILTGLPVTTADEAAAAADALCRLGVDGAVITLGDQGLCWADKNRPAAFLKGFPVDPKDVTGAGDALIAGTIYGLIADPENERNALEYGLAAAAIVVEHDGPAPTALSSAAVRARLT